MITRIAGILAAGAGMAGDGSFSAMSPSSAATRAADAALIARVAARDENALATLYDRYAPLLVSLAERILGDRAAAEDTVQEVLLEVWNRAATYDPDRASPSTWLILRLRSRAVDRLRSAQVRARAVDEASKESAAESRHASPEGPANVWFSERQARVRGALAELPADQRQVLEWTFFDGLSQREIAARHGVPLGTVKTRTLLGLRKLRAALRDEVRELL
jgi:RNA polymerase sigma-70 factor (ECF subfamily)